MSSAMLIQTVILHGMASLGIKVKVRERKEGVEGGGERDKGGVQGERER